MHFKVFLGGITFRGRGGGIGSGGGGSCKKVKYIDHYTDD